MNYIKKFQNAQALSVSMGNSYSEDQLMHIVLDNFHQGGKYTSQISNHQVELRMKETFTDQKYLSISSLQTDYSNLTSVQVLIETSKKKILFKNALFVEVLTILQINVTKRQERVRKIPRGWWFIKTTNLTSTSQMF